MVKASLPISTGKQHNTNFDTHSSTVYRTDKEYTFVSNKEETYYGNGTDEKYAPRKWNEIREKVQEYTFKFIPEWNTRAPLKDTSALPFIQQINPLPQMMAIAVSFLAKNFGISSTRSPPT